MRNHVGNFTYDALSSFTNTAILGTLGVLWIQYLDEKYQNWRTDIQNDRESFFSQVKKILEPSTVMRFVNQHYSISSTTSSDSHTRVKN
jgi:hypothetical protein